MTRIHATRTKTLVALAVLAILTAIAWVWIVQPLRNRDHFTHSLRDTLAEPHTLQIHTGGQFGAPPVTAIAQESPLWQPLHETLPQVRLGNVWRLDDGVYMGRYVDYVIFELKSRRRTVTLCLCSETHADLWVEEGPSIWHYTGSIAREDVVRIRKILPEEMTWPRKWYEPSVDEPNAPQPE